ncbi:MAG: hypothetical protein ACYSTG_05740 [Planctomycetota bacterium]|jgi:hypothetical protein
MSKRFTILGVLVNVVLIASVFGAETTRKLPLRDGFGLVGVDGKLKKPDSNEVVDRWFFELGSDVNDSIGRVSAGTNLELLPSSTLEKMIAETEKHLGKGFKLWGRVTKYKGRNFIFPIYFLPLTKTGKPGLPTLRKPQERPKEGQPAASPNSIATKEVPEPNRSGKSGEVVRKPRFFDPDDKLGPSQGIDEVAERRRKDAVRRRDSEEVKDIVTKAPKRAPFKRDTVLADRTGFLLEQDKGLSVFGFDALGRKVEQRSLRLLPCYALERTEQLQSEELDPVRLRIAGIVTRYKGKDYLLLERAVRVYSYENFGR